MSDELGIEPRLGHGISMAIPHRFSGPVFGQSPSRLMRSTGVTAALLEPVISELRIRHPTADVEQIQRAHEVIEALQRGQYRHSGHPSILHAVAVAGIVAQLGMDATTVVAALLHEIPDRPHHTTYELRRNFGPNVANVVDGVRILDKIQFGDAGDADMFRKMYVAMVHDVRVLVIKLADRLHNMRTLRFLPPQKQAQIARETLDVQAPLAHRLGMNMIRWELEDLAFITLHPVEYDQIVQMVAARAPSRDTYLTRMIERVASDLRAVRMKATLTGRPKHYYSIYRKIRQGVDLSDIHDLVGIRILVDSVRDCYASLGVVHATWQPVPGQFKDYIAMPKFNMYQSLHTTVIGPEGKPVELQIRTLGMHRTAEYGIAAHQNYPHRPTAGASGSGPGPAWLQQMLDRQRETQEPGEFLEALRFDLGIREVFVFTPKGDVISLPSGSTPVDFAYAVHTEVGHRCIGARVSGRLVSLEGQLENGDTVEVFTSKSDAAGPSRDWLGFVASPRAKTKIRQWFAKERREDSIDAGKDAISRAMRKAGLPLQRLLGGDALVTIARDLRYPDVTALFAAVGEHHASAQSVVNRLVASLGGREGAVEDIAETTVPTLEARRWSPSVPGVVVTGAATACVKLAKCCTPVPGDEILGIVTRTGAVSVHRRACTSAPSLLKKPVRLTEVEWAPSTKLAIVVVIQVEALDRHRLLPDITRVLSDEGVNILSVSVTTTRDNVAVGRFTFELGDAKDSGPLLLAIRSVYGVYDVYRVTTKD